MKKFKTLISFVLMAAMILTLVPSMGLVAMASDTITNLYFADNIVLDFSPSTTTYSVVVPWSKVNGYVLPELKWEPATVIPTITGGLDTGVLTVTDSTNTYTINLNKVGENMYENGGAESGNWQITNTNNSELVTDNPIAGSNSIKITFGAYYPDKKAEVFETNKTYLASSMVRRNADSSDPFQIYEELKIMSGTVTRTTSFWNADGTSRSGGGYLSGNEATTHYRTHVVSSQTEDAKLTDVYMNSGYRFSGFTVDEYFLGELVVADVKVTKEGETVRNTEVAKPAVGSSEILNLKAVKLNQLGNQAGLGSGTADAAWSVIGNPTGVIVNPETGVVTIDENAKVGTYTVEAVVETGFTDNAQKKAKGTYTINVYDPESKIALAKDVIFDTVAFDFKSEQTTYDIPVPVTYTKDVSTYTHATPKLIDYTLNDNATLDSKTDAVHVATEETYMEDTNSHATLVVKEGGSTKTYTFRFYLAGTNMYENGGVENRSWVASESSTMKRVKGGAYKGDYYMDISGAYYPDRTAETYVKDRIYLASSVLRLSDDRTEALNLYEELKNYRDNKSVSTTKYNTDGSARSGAIHLDTDRTWTPYYRTYKITNEIVSDDKYADICHPGGNPGWSPACYDADEYFMGELVANVDITCGGESKIEMLSPNADKSFTFNATINNQLGNKAGIGTTVHNFDWDVITPEDAEDCVVNENNVITVKANAEPGTYYITAETPVSIGNRQTRAKACFKLSIMGEGSLKSLKVSNTDIDFSGDILNYDVKVPVLHKGEKDTYVIPTVEAVAYEGDKVGTITYPEELPGVITIPVLSDDDITKEYMINLIPVGENKFFNGNLNTIGEYGYPSGWAIGGGEETLKDSHGIDGDYYMEFYQGSSIYGVVAPVTKPTLEAGKQYIYSNQIRKYNGTKATDDSKFIDTAKLNLEVITKISGSQIAFYTVDGEDYNNEERVELPEEWRYYITTLYSPNEDVKDFYADYFGSGSSYARYAIDDYFVGELAIADIVFTADKAALAASASAQTVSLTAKAVNNIGNLAGIKDKVNLTYRLGKDAPEGASVEVNDGIVTVTVPAGCEKSFEIEAVAVPTWTGAAQTNFVKAYEITIGDTELGFADDAVSIKFAGEAGKYKLVTAIYDVVGGELKFVDASIKDITKTSDDYTDTIGVELAEGQALRTFFWKWDELTPVIKSYTFYK